MLGIIKTVNFSIEEDDPLYLNSKYSFIKKERSLKLDLNCMFPYKNFDGIAEAELDIGKYIVKVSIEAKEPVTEIELLKDLRNYTREVEL